MTEPTIQYLAVLAPTMSGFSASLPDLPGCVTAGLQVADTLKITREAVALHLLTYTQAGRPVPGARTRSVVDLQPGEHTEWIEPASVNPVSLAVRDLIRSTGRSLRVLEGDTGMNYAVLPRMQDPFYWGHSLATLRRLAEALGRKVQVGFTTV